MQLNGMEFCVLWLTVYLGNFHKFLQVSASYVTPQLNCQRKLCHHSLNSQMGVHISLVEKPNPPLIPLMLPYLTFYYCPGFCYHDHYCLNHPHISLHCFLKVPSTTWLFLTLIPTIFAICCPNILPLLITAVNSFILTTSLLLISFLWGFSFNYFKLYYTQMHTQACIEMYVFMF